MAIETGLEGKPWYVSAAVGVVLAGAIVFGAHYLKFSDMKVQIESKNDKLTELQQEISAGRAAKANIGRFTEDVERLELELEKLLRVLPSRRKTDDLLQRFRALTEQGDFVLMRFTPGAPQPKDFYSAWPIRIQLRGTYHNLALFFDRVSRFSRIVNIDSMKIDAMRGRGGSGSAHTINSTFTAVTFLYNEPEEEEGAEL